jgi:hypothetical protein
MRKFLERIVVLAIVLAVLGGGGYWYWQSQATAKTSFRYAEIKRGRLVATVGATGTLQPRETVDIGAQVLGRIVYIGEDPNTKSKIVDWGSAVEGPVIFQMANSVKEASWSANTATINLSSNRGTFKSGQEVVITGLTPAAYNGTFTVRAANNTGFTFDLPLAAAPGLGGVAKESKDVKGVLLNPVASWSADVATINLTATITSNNTPPGGRSNPFKVGDTVDITGITPEVYNGSFSIRTVSDTGITFDLPLPKNPGAGFIDKEAKIVKLGTVLAQIDPDLYEAAVLSMKAALKAAQKDILAKQATLDQATAVLKQTTADWGRVQGLFTSTPPGVARAEYDQAEQAYYSAKANVELGKANLEVSEANVAAARANLKTAQTNLNYATISRRPAFSSLPRT